MIDILNKYLTLGTVLIFLLVFLLFIFFKVKNRVRIVIPYLISIILSVYIYEEVVLKSSYDFSVNLGDYSSGRYFKKQLPNIGYGPPDDGKYSSIKLINSDTVYDVSYTIKDKIRVTPSSTINSQKQVLFLGCSQTFGEGLDDDQTLPHFFGNETNKVLNIKNYGFHGYGPHNIHSLVVNNILPSHRLKTETIAIYNFYWYHINRAVRNVSGFEPWYEVENGKLNLKGTFNDRDNNSNTYFHNKYIEAFNNRVIRRSNIFRRHFGNQVNDANLNDIDSINIDRSLMLIRDINQKFVLNDIDFIVNIDNEIYNSEAIKNFFVNNKIKFICVECEIKDFYENESYIILRDGHHSEIANRVKANILKQKLLTLGFNL